MNQAPPPLVWFMTQAYAIRGGHEAHVLHFASELRQHGFDTRVRVLDPLPADEHRFMRLLREGGIPLDALRRTHGGWVGFLFAVLAAPWLLWMRMRGRQADPAVLRNYLADRAAARALRRRLRAERPAIVHVMGRLASYAWPELPVDRCVLHHGTEGRCDGTWDASEFAAFRAFAQRAARNFAPGEGVAANVRREFAIDRPIVSMFTICPDQALPAVPPQDGPLRFGLLCRMTPEKGIRDLLPALQAYRQRHGRLDFLIAGGGALEGEVRDFVQHHKLAGVRVQASFESPAELLRTLDVFVHPSLSDAMPLAIAEALMCGLPCIVTRVGGIPDLVRDGEEGILIEPGKPEQIVAAMERFQDMTPDARAAYARRARARYEAVCRPDRVGAAIAAEYRAILAAGTRL